MLMKNLIILLLLSIASLDTAAQKIYFTDTTNVWNYIHEPGWENAVVTYEYVDDTLVNGKNYFLLTGAGWLREDTAAGIIYLRKHLDSADIILYNYNLEIGDTFISYQNSLPGSDTFILISVDTVNIAGYKHKLQYFENYPDHFIGRAVIEGIGNMSSPFTLLPPHPDSYIITCFQNNKRIVSVNPAIGWFDNISSCELLSVDKSKHIQQVQIVPHPANSNSILQLPTIMQSGTLIVLNSMGQLAAKTNISQQSEIRIGEMIHIPGLYIYYLADNTSGKITTGKFVFEQ